jgi:rhodanese-related sulfurtransferase
VLAAVLIASLGAAACGGTDTDTQSDPVGSAAVESAVAPGIQVVSPEQAAATIADGSDDLVILDVRTPEEFDDGHIEGAVMLDFNRDDFAEQLSTFDPEVPYVMYCQSGNRSSGARAIMSELGFTSVEDIDGGIVGWEQAGLPTTSG